MMDVKALIGGVCHLTRPKIADSVVRRLVIYLRVLDKLAEGGRETVSSAQLAEQAGVSSASVRKDLAWFGEFGTRGVGYDIDGLRQELRRILKLGHEVRAVLVGAGSLGTALVRYNTRQQLPHGSTNVRIAAAFDNDQEKIGTLIGQVRVYDVSDLPTVVRQLEARLGIITVPAEAAQQTATRLIQGGVRAILNFAPATLNVPPEVQVQNADLTLEMQYLAYRLQDEHIGG